MNVKNFLVTGIIGGIVDWLLGWLFYGMLFADHFGGGAHPENMLFIALGCLTYGFFISYIYSRWAHISTASTGLTAGAVIGMFYGFLSNFFSNSNNATPDYQLIALDLVIMIVMGALVGATIGLVNGKLK